MFGNRLLHFSFDIVIAFNGHLPFTMVSLLDVALNIRQRWEHSLTMLAFVRLIPEVNSTKVAR